MNDAQPHLTNNDKKGTEWLEALNRPFFLPHSTASSRWTHTGRVLEFNPAAERVFGYTRAQAVGQELAELIIPPELRERHRRGLAHYLATGEGPVLDRRIEIAAVRADGIEILVELAITAFRIDDAPIFTAYLRDITERVRTERRRAAQYNIVSLLAGAWSLAEAGEQILQTIARSGNWIFGSIWLCEKRAKRSIALAPGTRGRATQILRSNHAPDAVEKIGRVTGTRY